MGIEPIPFYVVLPTVIKRNRTVIDKCAPNYTKSQPYSKERTRMKETIHRLSVTLLNQMDRWDSIPTRLSPYLVHFARLWIFLTYPLRLTSATIHNSAIGLSVRPISTETRLEHFCLRSSIIIYIWQNLSSRSLIEVKNSAHTSPDNLQQHSRLIVPPMYRSSGLLQWIVSDLNG